MEDLKGFDEQLCEKLKQEPAEMLALFDRRTCQATWFSSDSDTRRPGASTTAWKRSKSTATAQCKSTAAAGGEVCHPPQSKTCSCFCLHGSFSVSIYSPDGRETGLVNSCEVSSCSSISTTSNSTGIEFPASCPTDISRHPTTDHATRKKYPKPTSRQPTNTCWGAISCCSTRRGPSSCEKPCCSTPWAPNNPPDTSSRCCPSSCSKPTSRRPSSAAWPADPDPTGADAGAGRPKDPAGSQLCGAGGQAGPFCGSDGGLDWRHSSRQPQATP